MSVFAAFYFVEYFLPFFDIPTNSTLCFLCISVFHLDFLFLRCAISTSFRSSGKRLINMVQLTEAKENADTTAGYEDMPGPQ